MINWNELFEQYPELKGILDSVITVDVGNSFTKSNTGIVFPSKVSHVQRHVGKQIGVSNVIWNDTLYTVGNLDGKSNTDVNKYTSDHFILCMLNAIALSYKGKTDIKVRLSSGLPAQFYDDHYLQMKEALAKLGKQEININGIDYTIEILEARAYKQGGTLNSDMIEQFKFPMIMMDFGGGTLDVSLWRNIKEQDKAKRIGMVKAMSYTDFGFQPKMHEFISEFNSSEDSGGNYEYEDALEFLEENELPFGDENTLQDIKDAVMGSYIESVVSKVCHDFKATICKDIVIVGGPAEIALEYLAKELDNRKIKVSPRIIQDVNCQEANAFLFNGKHKDDLVREFFETHPIKEVAVDK